MTKQSFINDNDVRAFHEFLTDVFRSPLFSSVVDSYWWQQQDFATTQKRLDQLTELIGNLKSKPPRAAAIKHVNAWGSTAADSANWKRNGEFWLWWKENQNGLNNQLPATYPAKFGVGDSKVIAIGRPKDFVIYDSRVAFGLRRLLQTHLNGAKVPDILKFSIPYPRGLRKRERAKQLGWILSGSAKQRFKWMVLTSWLLRECLPIRGYNLRKLEAGLFVLGR